MDFMWVSDIPNVRKQNSYLSSHANNTIQRYFFFFFVREKKIFFSNFSFRSENITLSEDRSGQPRLPFIQPSNTASNGIHSRRSRADTMPSSTLPPYMELSPIYNTTQQRPNLDRSPLTTTTNTTSDQDMYHSGMSSPLDENASNSIASTLASLGLSDNDLTDTNNHTESRYFQPITRNRSMTLSSRDQTTRDMMSFSPFVSTNNTTTTTNTTNPTRQNRPRAVSLGMADLPPPSSLNGFSPFDSSFQQRQQQQQQQQQGNDYLQRNTSSGLTDNASLFQSRNLFTRMDAHEEEEDSKYMVSYFFFLPLSRLFF